jgi:Pectate lyase superfamily protein
MRNVKDFGAAGNGVVDDLAAINNAIAAAKADGGGVVFFPRGVYRVTNTIVVQADHIVLRGAGGGVDWVAVHSGTFAKMIASAASRIVWGGASGDGSLVSLSSVLLKFDVGQASDRSLVNHQGCCVEDLVLDGNNTAENGNGGANITFLALSHGRVRFSRVTCTQFKSYGINLGVTNNTHVTDWGSADNYFEDCVATNAGGSLLGDHCPLICWGDALRGNINRSAFIRCSFGSYGSKNAVSIEQADGLTFFGCHWGDPGGGQGKLWLHSDSSGLLSTRDGVRTGDGSQSRSCVFIGCEGPIHAKASTLSSGAHTAAHVAYGYTMENINAYPVIEPHADLTVYTTSTAVATNPGSGSLAYGHSFTGVHVFAPSLQSVLSGGSHTTVLWTDTDWDPLGASVSGRVVVPAGIKWVRAMAQILWQRASGGYRYAEINKGGVRLAGQAMYSAMDDAPMMLQSQWFRVQPGDIIDLVVSQDSGTTLTLISGTFLQVEFK